MDTTADPVDCDSRMRERPPRTTKYDEVKPRKRRGGPDSQHHASKRTKTQSQEAPKLHLVEREMRQRDPHLLKLHLSTVRQIVTEFDNELSAAGSIGPVDFAGIAGRLAGATGVCLSPEDVQLVVSDFSPHHYRASLGLVVMERPTQRRGQQLGFHGSVLSNNGHVIACAQAAGSRLREVWKQHRPMASTSAPIPAHEERADVRRRVQDAMRLLNQKNPIAGPSMKSATLEAVATPVSSFSSPQGPIASPTSELPFKYAGHMPILKSATLRVVPPRPDSTLARKPRAKPKPKAKARLAFPSPNPSLVDIQRYRALQYYQSEWLRLGQMAVANSMAARSAEMGATAETFTFAARRLLNAADADDTDLIEGLRKVNEKNSQRDCPSEELPFLGFGALDMVDESCTSAAGDQSN
ncbi:hypothetical protein Pmar_PMAR028242 [Perkinsus marinus ATCC 50983]|uniref:Uncharacterized protein n=1 Tax=Perkinsus marinus (strain ATCC 50983 / TXsc) TaxID=423536 RepID=C5LBC5_PERM5|nr:hypothetical protein Pmar_PMAR028242 [Perkinsus marinus ATCC 50983]EER06053.1 hypothetical protein Pmar_PMAR028242 [Perkinsus marinus ATCC 50983]|eukprot:XP_002774237.1 hypothetical protein Pmar_PMAR028242 [Perkinsus marinus ATCC 50983]